MQDTAYAPRSIPTTESTIRSPGASENLSHTPAVKPAREGELVVPALGALLLLALAGVGSYLSLYASAGLSAAAHGDTLREASARVQADLVSLTLAQLAGMGLALWAGVRWFGPDASIATTLSLFPIRGRTAALCLLSGACLQFPLAELSNLLHHHVLGPESLEDQLAMQTMIEAPSLGRGLLVVACLVAAVPAMEELFFRGLLLFGLRARYGDAAAILVSACLFGVSHLNAVAAVYAATAGIVLGVLALRTRSIWPGIALHAAVNAMPVLLPERLIAVRGFNVPSATPLHLPAWLVLSTLVVGSLFLAWAIRIEYRGEP